MKPLRPHNYYGGTTCPGRATGQVSTIRSLIPKEDEMDQGEFNKMFKQAIESVGFPAKDSDGKTTSGAHTLLWWTELFRSHQENQGKYRHDGAGGATLAQVRDIACQEDARLKISKQED